MLLEAHITTNPIPAEAMPTIEAALERYGFRFANLYKKDHELSTEDSFCTAHGDDLLDLQERMKFTLNFLRINFVKIRRYKIEAVLLDSRTDGWWLGR